MVEEDGEQFLLLEWINSGIKNESFWKSFGAQLAQLHQVTNNDFGWKETNYMGAVPQQNKWEKDWIAFFTNQRLLPLINNCRQRNLLTAKEEKDFEKLITKLPQFFDKNEKPSLLHGDLWAGNFMCNQQSQPVLIDPAVYFGHRSMDLAMTTLFGGFDERFYDTYQYYFPFPNNYKEQWKICNLYPLLIHLALFGASYLASIQNTLTAFA